MLQRLLLITLTLCSLTASAQWQQTGSKVRYVNGLGIPTKDTAAGVAADSSQILIRPADSSLYIKYKRTWVKVGAGGGGTIGGSGTINRVPKFTAGTTLGNSSIVDSASAVAMTINPSGNVGIGTASPAQKLDVNGAILAATSLYKNIAGTNVLNVAADDQQYGGSSTDGGIFVYGNNKLHLSTNSSRQLTVAGSGNVGIGYTAPATKLSVSGTTLINTNTDNGVDRLQVSGSMSVGSIKASGNVGIYNSSPFYALSVGDGTSTRQVVINGLNSGTNGGSSIAVQANSATTMMFGNKSNVTGGAYDGQPVFGFGGSTNSLQFYNFNTLNVPAMISSGDRFLIGTTTDNGVDKLQVNGSSYYTGQMQQRITSPRIYLDDSDNTGTASLWFRPQSASFLIRGAVELISKGSAAPTEFRISAKDTFTIRSNDVEKLRIPPSGRILANTTTDNTVDQLQVNGSISGIGFKQNYVTKTGAYTATDADYVIDCTSGTFTVTLPASSGRTGRILIIKNSGAGTITVDGNGAETIDGAATYSLAVQYATVQIMSDGTNWKIIAKF